VSSGSTFFPQWTFPGDVMQIAFRPRFPVDAVPLLDESAIPRKTEFQRAIRSLLQEANA
jgi:hypothetical protein